MIIATRLLKLDTPAGAIDVPVRLYAPTPDGTSWKCEYEIDWPERDKRSAGVGIDAAHAIQLAMQKIAIELYTSTHHKSGKLYWERPGGGYGFPIMKNSRDLLVGDDKEFDG